MSWLNKIKDESESQDKFYEFDFNHKEFDLIDINSTDKYLSLGLSLNSQEVICEFYQLLNNQQNSDFTRIFENMLFSIFDDMIKYKKESMNLEKSYKKEKEKNEEIIKNMIEEAERQLLSMTEIIKKEEKIEYEKLIDKLKLDYSYEVMNLKQKLSKMDELENNLTKSKLGENEQLNALKIEIKNKDIENNDLKFKLRESQTEISVLKSNLADLKEVCNERISENKNSNEDFFELIKLKQEISALHDANKKLNDTNDVLRNDLHLLKLKSPKNEQSNFKIKEKGQISKFNFKLNSSILNSSFENDYDHDSGYLASSYELSELENSIFLPNNLRLEPDLIENTVQAKPIRKHVNSIQKSQNLSNVPERIFKIVFAGDSGVGKTSFIMRFCKGIFNTSTTSTLGVDFQLKMIDLDGKTLALQLWDTCGQERFRSIAKSYFRRADGVVLMYDCTNEKSFLNVREWIDIINDSSEGRIPVVLIGNKIDLRDKLAKNRRVIETQNGNKLAKQYQSLFIETSAKDGSNIDDSLIEMCRIMSSNQDIELKTDSIQLGLNTPSKKKNCC